MLHRDKGQIILKTGKDFILNNNQNCLKYAKRRQTDLNYLFKVNSKDKIMKFSNKIILTSLLLQ